MGSTISIRLPEDLARWLHDSAAKAGVSQGSLIREQMEKARTLEEKPFMRLAGKVSRSPDLSMRKGFSAK